MKLLFLACFMSAPAYADTFACRADFDAGAHYELSATMEDPGIAGDVDFQYQDESNHMRAALKPSSQNLIRDREAHLTAGNANMEARVDTDFDASNATYEGAIHVAFHVQNIPPVDLPVSCTWR